MIHEGFAQKQNRQQHQAPSVSVEQKSDISFAQTNKEHDTCNYVRHDHEFMPDF